MNRAPRFTALVKSAIGWAIFFLIVFLLSVDNASAGDCPPPVAIPRDGDTCTATLQTPARDYTERVSVFVVRLRDLEAADLVSWSVPGAVVVIRDGLRKGQTMSVPLSLLSGCRS